MPHRTNNSDQYHDDQDVEHDNGDGHDSDSEPDLPDATAGMVELGSDEFPDYFSERNDRLFHSSTSPYPLPVDTPEQQVRVPCRQLQILANFFRFFPCDHGIIFNVKRLRALHNLLHQLLGVNCVGPVAEVLAPQQDSDRQRIALDVCTGNGTWYVRNSFFKIHADI